MGSTSGSKAILTTVCATRSATVGTPRMRSPPFFFGMATAFTGGGKYVPDDIRFQSLYRLFFKSASKSAIDCSSTPQPPALALTALKASYTSFFGMLNAFAALTAFLLFPVVSTSAALCPSPFAQHPITGPSLLLQAGPSQRVASVHSPRGFMPLVLLPFASTPWFPRFRMRAQVRVTPSPRRSPPAQYPGVRQAYPQGVHALGFDDEFFSLRRVNEGFLSVVSLTSTGSGSPRCFNLQRSPPRLLTAAAWSGLEPAPESRLR